MQPDSVEGVAWHAAGLPVEQLPICVLNTALYEWRVIRPESTPACFDSGNAAAYECQLGGAEAETLHDVWYSFHVPARVESP